MKTESVLIGVIRSLIRAGNPVSVRKDVFGNINILECPERDKMFLEK